MEIVLARHAQPAWSDPDGRARNDPGLTPTGRRQAEALAARLSVEDFDEVLCSPAVRTRQTAEPLEEETERSAAIHPWLVEIGLPDAWEGTPEQEVVATLGALRRRPRDEWWAGAPGGERFDDFHARVTGGLDAFLEARGVVDHPEDPMHLWDIPADGPRVLLIAHAGTSSVIISHLLGLQPQPWEWERFPSNHAAVSVLRSREVATGSIWALEHFSDVAHIPDGLVTH